MSPARSALALFSIALVAMAAIVSGDLGAGTLAPRELLLLVALGGAWAAAQALLVQRSRESAGGTVLIVRDGAVGSARNALPGRTVSLLVHGGQAVVTENLGRYSRVLPPGLATLKPGESVFKIVSTQPRTLSGTVDCATREGIPVGVDFEVTAQIAGMATEPDAAPGAAATQLRPAAPGPRPDGPAWSSAAVVRAAYGSHNWESAVLTETRAVVRDLVVQTYLDALNIPVSGSGSVRRGMDDLQDRAHPKISAAARGWGVSVTAVRVHSLRLPAEVSSTLLRSWSARAAAPPARAGGLALTEHGAGTSEPASAILVAPVLNRAQFSTLRQALREPAAMVGIRSAGVDGRSFCLGSTSGDALDLRLRPDRSYFALRVQGSIFRDLSLADGDYVVLEEGADADDADVVAASWEGRIALWRFWKRADHTLLAPELGTRSPIALISTPRLAANIRQFYSSQHPPVQVLLETDVKVLGRVVAALREAQGGCHGEDLPRAVDADASSEPRARSAETGEVDSDPLR